MSVRTTAFGVAAALGVLVAAQLVGREAAAQRDRWPKLVETPYAPAPGIAHFVTLGYSELGADVLYIRLKVYFGGNDSTAAGLRALVDAIVALDPHFLPVYEFGARAISWVDSGMTQADRRWSIELLERGIREFPDNWRLLKLAGETYIVDLETDDPAQRTAWNERGAALLEQAIRMPDAPRNLGALVAEIRTQLGQHQRAVDGLLELIRTTDDKKARDKLVAKLAEIEGADATNLADEETWMKERFDRAWQKALPEAPAEMYILLGDPPKRYIDLADLSAAPDLGIEDETYEPLE